VLRAGISVALLPLTVSGQVDPPSESLGDVHFEVSCNGEAQARFDRAVALLHHMTYSRARAEFSAVALTDPGCAMAHWGVAMTLFQPLWPTRPGPEDLRLGWEAVSRAREIGPGTDRERMFVAATAAFFDPGLTDHWERIARWAAGMRAVYEAYPEDVETRVFFSLSHLATAPASGDLDHNVTAAAVLEAVLRTRPTHPGAIHYTIHANDAVGRETESLDVVRRYGGIAPRNPHALHMPTHIYVRIGDWSGVIAGNRQAAAAALENPVGDRRQWVWDEFPHAIEYLVYALLQVGDDSAALRAMVTLQQTADLEPSFKTAFHLSSIPARYALERRDWAEAAGLEPRPNAALPWDRFPWPEAVTWFARGVGAVRTGSVQAGREAETRLGLLRDASERLGEDLFARQTEILRLGVAAWLARAGADEEGAIRLMQQAARLEASTPKHPVTPAPTLPAAEMLGDLLLELGRPEAALRAYQSSLVSAPRRFNSLVGAARSARSMGDPALAARHYRELRELAVTHSRRPELIEAAAFLDRQANERGRTRPGPGWLGRTSGGTWAFRPPAVR
jgi:tetratricopeptide (TPR) repeat protein